ncbi:U-box domain-containing protein 26-like [Pyrus x bretschneideri]|uniref:U-box domain-containing protein 26-like n=1 Tax=Pyrus x bretschneideri TaxID=225117 RepID=UPI00202EC366|nr:U-box domain-containing protein 26-like [Pyrus x bretschneideri]
MKEQVEEMRIPHLFKCPISLDLFKDPVTLCTGQTYDRSSIEKWLSSGNLSCPVTMQKLHDPSMVPNHTLRHFINQWLEMDNQFDPHYLQTIDYLSSLKCGLKSRDEGTLESKVQALKEIRAFSQLESPFRNNLLLQLRFLPLLLELVFGGGEAELKEKQKLHEECYYHIDFVEQALCCIITLLPLSELESLNMLREENNLASFQALFANSTTSIRMSLCHLIEAASTSPETKGLCSMLGKNNQLLHQILAQLLHQNLNSEEDGDAAIKAVSALSSLEENREFLVKQGVVNGLTSYMISSVEGHKRNLAPLAVATLEKLLGLESAREAVISNPNGIQAVVKMVFRVSDDHGGSDSAVGSLIILCNDSLLAREEAISGGVLTQLLLLLQSQCSGQTKTKARMLLKLLRIKWSQEANQLL